MIGKADVVYADLPCSGLGILGKKRDIRYRMNPEQMEELVELQQKILSVIWQYVKPGGTLMYSTCTIHRAENEQMVQWFTQNFPFERQSMKEHRRRTYGTVKRTACCSFCLEFIKRMDFSLRSCAE